MRRFLQRFTAALLVTLTTTAGAALVVVEDAVEMQPINVQLTSDSTGLAYVNGCDGCKALQLVITGTTQASLAGKPISLSDVKQYRERGATLFYDKATRIVTRIVVWK
jgi:hypothetical protein